MTAPAAITVLELWVDGTLNSGALNANFGASSTWNKLEFGNVVLASGSPNGTGTLYFDETIVSNAYNGPLP